MSLKYSLNVATSVSMDGFRQELLKKILLSFGLIPKRKKIEFTITDTNTSEPYDVYWKVRNVGQAASDRNKIREAIWKSNKITTNPLHSLALICRVLYCKRCFLCSKE